MSSCVDAVSDQMGSRVNAVSGLRIADFAIKLPILGALLFISYQMKKILQTLGWQYKLLKETRNKVTFVERRLMDLAMSPHEAVRQIRTAIESFDETMDSSWLTRQLQNIKTVFSASTLRTKGNWDEVLWPAVMHEAISQLRDQLQRKKSVEVETNLRYIAKMVDNNQPLYMSSDSSAMLQLWPTH